MSLLLQSDNALSGSKANWLQHLLGLFYTFSTLSARLSWPQSLIPGCWTLGLAHCLYSSGRTVPTSQIYLSSLRVYPLATQQSHQQPVTTGDFLHCWEAGWNVSMDCGWVAMHMAPDAISVFLGRASAISVDNFYLCYSCDCWQRDLRSLPSSLYALVHILLPQWWAKRMTWCPRGESRQITRCVSSQCWQTYSQGVSEMFRLSLIWFQVDAVSALDGFSPGKVERRWW